MAAKKQKARRKMYATEFLIRSDNPTLIKDLETIADQQNRSINLLIVNELEKVIKKHKKNSVISE